MFHCKKMNMHAMMMEDLTLCCPQSTVFGILQAGEGSLAMSPFFSEECMAPSWHLHGLQVTSKSDFTCLSCCAQLAQQRGGTRGQARGSEGRKSSTPPCPWRVGAWSATQRSTRFTLATSTFYECSPTTHRAPPQPLLLVCCLSSVASQS